MRTWPKVRVTSVACVKASVRLRCSAQAQQMANTTKARGSHFVLPCIETAEKIRSLGKNQLKRWLSWPAWDLVLCLFGFLLRFFDEFD